MSKLHYCLIIGLFIWQACSQPQSETTEESTEEDSTATAQNNSPTEEESEEGVKVIPIHTPQGEFNVWTKKIGDNPSKKVLLLHGGPGATHELYECFEKFFPAEGIEFYYYDQLGSFKSDQPKDSSLWTTERFVEEVEQVRQALGLNKDNFYLLGQSWGGILAMEYALKYQENLKGLVIANMMSSCPEYDQYADEVLAKQMDPEVLKEIRDLEEKEAFENPRYMELLMEHHYKEHVLRLEEWPEEINRCFEHVNPEIYVLMQGPSEFGIGGRLANWDRKADLSNIRVPTLVIGAKYDTMDPEHMEWMSKEVAQGRYLFCPEGSHLSQYDDQETFFTGLIQFVKDVDGENF